MMQTALPAGLQSLRLHNASSQLSPRRAACSFGFSVTLISVPQLLVLQQPIRADVPELHHERSNKITSSIGAFSNSNLRPFKTSLNEI